MENKDLVRTSKFLSLVLRHAPEKIGLVLDENGWADVSDLIERARGQGVELDRALLNEIVSTNDKKRFAFNVDGLRIRANQGHSVDIELALEPRQPPEILYHGTATRFIDSIKAQGLHSGERQHVHLSADEATAIKVGQRHGKPVVLTVRSGEMHRAGRTFVLSENGVWLTEKVPAEYIGF